MCKSNDHNFKVIKDLDNEIIDYGRTSAKWKSFLIILCTRCGKLKRKYIDDIK